MKQTFSEFKLSNWVQWVFMYWTVFWLPQASLSLPLKEFVSTWERHLHRKTGDGVLITVWIQTQHECPLRGQKKAEMTSDLNLVCCVPQGKTWTKQNEHIRRPKPESRSFRKNGKQTTFTGEADGLTLSELVICPNKISLISLGSVPSSACFIVKRI